MQTISLVTSPRRRPRSRAVAGLHAALVLALGLAASPSFAELARESRPVAGIERVVLRTVGELEITQAADEGLVVEAEPRVLRQITTEVSRGTLTIDMRGGRLSTEEPIRYRLRVRRPTAIESTASGSVRSGSLEVDRLELVQAGSGEMRIGALAAATLAVDVAESGSVRIASGRVDRASIRARDAGAIAASGLSGRDVTVDVAGSAEVAVAAEKSLDATVRDAGRVTYRGNPTLRQRVEDAGSLEREAGR